MDNDIANKGTLLYHVSNKVEKEPYLRCDKDTKVFSWGFYCFINKGQALEEAKKVGANAVINVYSLRAISNLKVKVFNEPTEEWFDFIISCKEGALHNYDVVKGLVPIECEEGYISEKINKAELMKVIKTNIAVEQISFHTVKALTYLTYKANYVLRWSEK